MSRRYEMKQPRGPRGPYRTRIKALDAEIARQLAGGRSARSIARELGCHHDTILAVARRHGIVLAPLTTRADPVVRIPAEMNTQIGPVNAPITWPNRPRRAVRSRPSRLPRGVRVKGLNP